MFIKFWDILINEQIFFSPQAKRSVIISNKQPSVQSSSQNESFVNISKKLLK